MKQDVVSPGYRTFILKNIGTGLLDNLGVQVLEAGVGSGDASQLSNRSIVTMAFTRLSTGLPETQYLGVSPLSVLTEDPAEISPVLLNGWLQLSADTFRWANKLLLPALAVGESLQLYSRYSRPAYATPNTFQFTLQNIGTDTLQNTVLTAQGSDLLSLDGVTFTATLNLGNLAPSVQKTVYVKSYGIDPGKLGPAQIQILQVGKLLSSLPFDAIGFGRYYSSVSEVTKYLTTIDVSVVTTDEEIRDLILRSANEIDRATRRRFDVVTVTERYNGVGQQKLVLDNYPIISVQEVQIYNPNNQLVADIKSTDSNFATELIIESVNGFITLPSPAIPNLASPLAGIGAGWQPLLTPYYPQPSAGVPYDYSTHFGRGIANIAITYTYGYQVPPEGIRDACMKMVVIELLKKKGTSDSQGAATVAVAGMSESFAARGAQGGGGPYAHVLDELQGDVDATLELFRKRRWGVV